MIGMGSANSMTSVVSLPIDAGRLWNDLMTLADITDPEKPYTRRSFSPCFLEGRAWLRRRFEDAGLEVRLDPAANLIGRWEGTNRATGTIMLGSHSDTVPSGGRFDGPAGVIAALEIVRSLEAAGIRLHHTLEIVDFLAEEPSEYGLSCIGSRAMAGLLEPKMLDYTNASGERLEQAIKRVGGNTARLGQAYRGDVVAFFELHIEQGAVLETKKIDLGLVTGIVGIARVEIIFEGAADHAGTTPMDLRRDAGLAAAQLVTLIGERARELARIHPGHFVATTGVLEIRPNAANVVPGHARVVVDVRAEDQELMNEFVAELDAESEQIAARTRTSRQSSLLSRTASTACDPRLRGLLEQSAADLGFSTMPLASGAGHDAAFLSCIAPSAMLFIPCREGKSHAPEEWTEPVALAAGAATILETVRRFDLRDRQPHEIE
jgi:N-carbamoyl-L-amino-acid hydrolase